MVNNICRRFSQGEIRTALQVIKQDVILH